MRSIALAVAFTLVSTASAQPREMSQNPRVGLLAEIKFGQGSARLPEASGSQLGRVAAWAEENFDGLVVLDGHADRAGRARDNIGLSLRRARLVRDQLIDLGVDPNQIVVTAFGSDDRRHTRVTIWGTHNTLEQVIAARRTATYVHWGPEPIGSGPQLMGRRSPAHRR